MWHELQQEKARLKHQHEHFQEFMQGAFNEVRVFVVLQRALKCSLTCNYIKKLSRVLGSKFGMGYLKFLEQDRKKLLKDH